MIAPADRKNSRTRDWQRTGDSLDRELPGFSLKIVTPENVRLSYTPAGPGSRAAAYFIDMVVRLMATSAIAVPIMCAGVLLPGTAIGVFMLIMFANTFFYFVLLEYYWNGRSIGKRVFGLRVIHERGYPVTFWTSVTRNLLRIVDSLGFYGIGLISMTLSPDFRRIGDWVGRTIVIKDRPAKLPTQPVILDKIESLSRGEINSFVPSQSVLSLIDRFLARRHVLSVRRGHQMARPLAMALAERLNFSGDVDVVAKYPMAFLARVHATFLRRNEVERQAGVAAIDGQDSFASARAIGRGVS
ncbi:RDD family protein [Stratiformator vulcanicus]|uniref:RDD family protein n=1 Tax=Stratiformator vulcanicus TaxID=2527980 RepID=A0A517QXB5_9PLAN|nr:RDD family protein [Stratiformator vulcanicus]QDT36306.1 RDD family protein [Stratiformator vulcanicus]